MAKLNYSFGQLNAVERPNIADTYDPEITSGVDSLKRSTTKLFTDNTLSRRGRWRGVILRKEGLVGNPPDSWLNNVWGRENPGVSKWCMAVCYIPELHGACLPDPFKFSGPSDGGLDPAVVDMYPIFYGPNDKADPGDIAELDFSDKVNAVGGIYIGKSADGTLPPPTMATSQNNFQREPDFIPDVTQFAEKMKCEYDESAALSNVLIKGHVKIPKNPKFKKFQSALNEAARSAGMKVKITDALRNPREQAQRMYRNFWDETVGGITSAARKEYLLGLYSKKHVFIDVDKFPDIFEDYSKSLALNKAAKIINGGNSKNKMWPTAHLIGTGMDISFDAWTASGKQMGPTGVHYTQRRNVTGPKVLQVLREASKCAKINILMESNHFHVDIQRISKQAGPIQAILRHSRKAPKWAPPAGTPV